MIKKCLLLRVVLLIRYTLDLEVGVHLARPLATIFSKTGRVSSAILAGF